MFVAWDMERFGGKWYVQSVEVINLCLIDPQRLNVIQMKHGLHNLKLLKI